MSAIRMASQSGPSASWPTPSRVISVTPRQYTYLAGGSPFTLSGVDPDGFGTAELGVDMSVNRNIGLWLSGSYSFGGQNKVGAVRAGIDFLFGGGHTEAAPAASSAAPAAAPAAPAAPAVSAGLQQGSVHRLLRLGSLGHHG